MAGAAGGQQNLPTNEAFYALVRRRTAERFRSKYVTTNSQVEGESTKEKLKKFKSIPDSPYNFNNALLILLSIAVFYLTDAAAVVLFDYRVDWWWMKVGATALGVSTLCCFYCVVYLSWYKKVHNDNWEKANPFVIPIATMSGIVGGVFVTGAVWPVWGVLAIPIVAIEFIGFVCFIAMIPNIF